MFEEKAKNMKYTSFLLILLLFSGCTSLFNEPVYTLESGGYWVQFNMQKPEQWEYADYWMIDNKNGNLSIRDLGNGNKTFPAIIQDNLFLASSAHYNNGNRVYKGKITENNRIEGVLNGKMSCPVVSNPPKVREKELAGTFVITLSNKIPTPIERVQFPTGSLTFLPISKYCKPMKNQDPRAISIMIDKSGTIYNPDIIKFGYYGRCIDGKSELTNKQLKNELNAGVEEYGTDFPVLLYADKNATLSSCETFFYELNDAGLYRLRFITLYPKRMRMGTFSIDVFPYLEELKPDKEKVLVIKILKDQILVNGNILSEKAFESYIEEMGKANPDQQIVLKYLEKATVQQLVRVLSVFQIYDLNKIGLYRSLR